MTSVSTSSNPFSAHHPTQGPRRSCPATPNTHNTCLPTPVSRHRFDTHREQGMEHSQHP